VFVVVLVVLFIAVDRVAVAVADRLVADKLQSAEHLASRPDVSIRGFPLLTQVARQRYRDIHVTMRDLKRGSLVATRLDVDLRGVHVATGDLLSRHIGEIPVESARGTVLLSYADIAAMVSGHGVTVGYAGHGLLSLRESAMLAGTMLQISGTAGLRIDGTDLVVTPGPGIVNQALSSLAEQRLAFRVPLSGLPFDVQLVAVKVRGDGVRVSARSHGLVIDVSG
jgi:hypothetical protein